MQEVKKRYLLDTLPLKSPKTQYIEESIYVSFYEAECNKPGAPQVSTLRTRHL